MNRLLMKILLLVLCLACMGGCALAQATPYSVKLTAGHEIYSGPGEDSGFLKTVGESGVYTIVQESYDSRGNLWGRLRSGAGWVILARQSGEIFSPVPYTIKLASTVDICAGPGYAYGYSCDVAEDGIYTIVEEAVGADGCVWGRLKSGVGWVRLRSVALEVTPVGSFSPYTVNLAAWVPVYTVPNYDYGRCAGIVGVDTVYTIVDEVTDHDGNIWGCLKSGAGWVDFSYISAAGDPPMTAYFADVIDLGDQAYPGYTGEDSEYTLRIAFRANEDITGVRLDMLEYDGESYKVHESLDALDGMAEDTYYVAGVVFYGDMTTYGVSFTDADGVQRHFSVMLSGRNGEVVFSEYTPE